MLTLTKLWKKLAPGGVYIIEDIETSYWGKSELYGYAFNANRYNAMKKIIAGISFVNWEFLTARAKKRLNNQELSAILKEVEIITFAYNSIIMVKKDVESFEKFYRNNYKRKNRIEKNSVFRKLKRIVKPVVVKN